MHPLSAHVWAGILINGTRDIVIVTGIMEALLSNYCERISLIIYQPRHRLVMDNDPKTHVRAPVSA